MMSSRARRMAVHHQRHKGDFELNLIPLIDILSVMVAFLLVFLPAAILLSGVLYFIFRHIF